MKKIILMGLGSFFVFASTAMAATNQGVVLDVGYIMIDTTNNPAPSGTGSVSGTDSEIKQTYMDIKLGYLFGNDLYGGIIYDTYTLNVSGGTTVSRNLLGATIGYHHEGYFIDLSYFLSGKLADYFGAGSELSSPSGFGLDFGYNFMLTSNFYLGVQLSYKNVSYGKYKPAGGSEVSTTWKQSEMYPMLKLGFVF